MVGAGRQISQEASPRSQCSSNPKGCRGVSTFAVPCPACPPVIPSEARDLLLKNSKQYYVYILASRSRTLYTGVTDNLRRRIVQHRHGLIEGFTRKYRIRRLVYFETFADIRAAIVREKQIKGWRRDKKVALITTNNPTWENLAAA